MKRLTRIALATFVVLGLGAGTALADRYDHDNYRPRSAPPAQRYQQVDHRAGYVFVQGHWDWQYNQWVWMPGHWERARTGYRWTDGGWDNRGGRWQWRAGRWDRDHDGIPNRYDRHDDRFDRRHDRSDRRRDRDRDRDHRGRRDRGRR